MRDQMEFDMLLDEVLREVANPEPVESFEQRVMRRIEVGQTDGARVLVAAGYIEKSQVERFQIAANATNGKGLFGTGLREQGVFGSLWSGVRDLIFPAKLPPLVLESRQVTVVDRMAVQSNYPSTAYAVVLHAAVILLIGFVVRAQIRDVTPARENVTALVDPPVAMRLAPKGDQIQGGGGQRGSTPATRGHLPKLEQEQIVPPKIPPLQAPKIAIEPSVVVQKDLKMADNAMPDLGMPNSPLVGRSMGSGRGMGMGSGDGDGIGPGSGGNAGGGVRQVGGGVSEPKVLFQPEPEFSEEARKAKASGNVMVYLWVDEHGNPTHVRVVRGIGLGLDEKAAEAVRQYKFRPALENGKPVTVEMYIDVTFQIF
jgi:periplasmic protein TonB